jgi:metal-responsive CopG/Arc/MetJ family transcriptional regulator
MKFRKREKQVGVRLRAEEHAALKAIAEKQGYESVSEFVRALIEKAIEENNRKSCHPHTS